MAGIAPGIVYRSFGASFNFSCNFSLGKSFRQEQCEVRNGPQTDPKGVKTFVEWVPKYAGVLPKDVCKLICRAKGTGYYVVFSQRVSELGKER